MGPASSRAYAAPRALRQPARWQPRAAASFGLAFLLPFYLALQGGGYDDVLRGEVGIAIWWLVLLGALVGVLPAVRWERRTWLFVAVIGAFAGWTALGISWSHSAGRSVNELGRVATYAGVLVLALGTFTAQSRRYVLGGLTTAIGLIATLSLLSRLHPQWFGADVTAQFLPGTRSRLAYPMNYWNAVAAFVAMGVPLALGAASGARRLVFQALAAVTVPVMAATIFLTLSRGGALALAVGLLALLALAPERVPKMATLLNTAAGSAIVIGSLTQRAALRSGFDTAPARSQGARMIVVMLLVCAGVALVQVGIGLAARHGRLGLAVRVSPRRAAIATLSVIVLCAVAFTLAGGPDRVSRAWSDFKRPTLAVAASQGGSFQRFGATSGNGRYQFWSSALDAASAHPLTGIGPGTFEFWWAQHASLHSYVVNAHSLYFETLAELGVPGLLLIFALVLGAIAVGAARALRAPPARRLALSAAVAACASFAVSAGVDWVWQVPAIAAAFLILAALLVGPAGAGRTLRERRLDASPAEPVRAGRWIVAAVAVAALVAIAIPLSGTVQVRESQAQAAAGHLSTALTHARSAHSVQPYAAIPSLQQALVLELQKRYGQAVAVAAAATRAEATNWRTWLVLSRVEAEDGHVDAAIAAYRRARELNPTSPIFAQR